MSQDTNDSAMGSIEPPPAELAPPVGEREAEALSLWVVLARTARSIHEVAAAHAASHGLTLAEFGALEALYHKGPLLVGDIQKRILVSSGGATYVVDRLQQRGLVERRDSPVDRRARLAALTDSGVELVRRIFPEHAAVIRQVFSVLPREQFGPLREQLKALGIHAQGLERGENG
ncbi:MAG TPA: MarR family transcriptional regulator [Gemmatimonadales bacterium]|nr:MarR family transcriptional regulator [Gemmatimonadales bacterium]